ncbi:MAG: hypothetical protein A3I32_02855 [Candidatus Yanofskybacteria bacterium RIFCSPLOWO2_02_FULL_45_10]|uniref:Membrane protein insertion efficiency factor YidD n=2 Tax=Candidatus Yanofskyibacteriota TaxID=1752733 RepID=A0A1F8G0A7_9BACT|nr:MAG: hypothetical protein A3F25_02700 [Candidatus Yanofskybacteria bacterium RIFCSPHIGHO2_12_FULL_45_19b]OGN31590.1 MAG: hypothetical protein A3I32_02855 [Candidatus Yanofskybacteria bacterium RIFCSPLOWO2_02_FULL_45_10]
MYYKKTTLKLLRVGLFFYRQTIARSIQWLSLTSNSNCRFYPTCSEYAEEVITRYGWWRGLRLASRRLLKCNPLTRI